MLKLIVFLIAGAIIVGIFIAVGELLLRLFWLAARLCMAVAVAIVGAALTSGPEEGVGLLGTTIISIFLLFLTLRLNRSWGRGQEESRFDGQTGSVDQGAMARSRTDAGPAVIDREAADHTPLPDARDGRLYAAGSAALIDPALSARLVATEMALETASRDDIGQPAAEWLMFLRNRVPDLLNAALEVYVDAGPAGRRQVACELSVSLEAILTEADDRLSAVLKARQDLFATRDRHAAARISNG